MELARGFGSAQYQRAQHHREIIRRFGRFPHRNPIQEEQRFLDEGGFAGYPIINSDKGISMNILIIGASRGVGRHVVQQALDKGHHVTAFARDPSTLPSSHERLAVLRGDATNEAEVRNAVPGHGAVVSALGGDSRRGPT